MKPTTSAPLLVLASLCVPAMADLTGDWNLEEGTGVTLEQISLTASDALRTGVTWSTTDTPGPASTASMQFDGSNSGNYATSARLGMNRNAANLGINGAGDKTIIAWIKTTQTDKRYFWGWSPGNGLTAGGDLRLGIENSGKLRFEVSNGFTRYDGISLNDGNWHMVAVVINAGDTIADVQFYIDGDLYTPTANNTQAIDTLGTGVGGDSTPNEFFFASGGNSATQLWIGGIDDFRIYNTALSDTELDAIRAAMAVAPPPTLVWNNASSDGIWNTTSVNWNNGSTDQAFTDGDKVGFEDLPGAFETVTIPGTVAPQQLTLDTFATEYEFTGAGGIGGSGPVAIIGGGITTFSNTGGIATSGSLSVAEQSWVLLGAPATPSSTSIENASILEFLDGASISGPITNNGSLIDSSTTGTLALSNVISGSGALTKDGASTLVLDAVNTFIGTVTVNSGVLRLTPATGKLFQTGGFFGTQNVTNIAINSGGVFETWNWSYGDANALSQLRNNYGQILLNGGTIRFTQSFSNVRAFTVGFDGGTIEAPAGVTYTKPAGTIGSENIIRFAADSTLTLTGEGDIVIGDSLGAYGATGFSLAKTGTGTLTLTGSNTYTGTTTVSGGTLAVNGTALPDASSLIIDGGVVAPTGTETVATLFFGATQQAAGTWGATDSGAEHIDDTRFSGSGVIEVTTGPGLAYTTWAAANAGGDGPDLDSDGDGVPNGVEFLMGESGSTFTPNPALVAGTITWPKDPTALATWSVETSTNLQDEVTPGDGGWTTATTGVTDNGDSIEFTPGGGGERLFIRLRVAIP